VGDREGRGDEAGLRGALRIGVRGWVNDLFQIVNLRLDLFILNAYETNAQVGVYGVAVTVTSLAWILAQALATVVLPRSAALRAGAGRVDRGDADPMGASAVRHAVVVSLAVSVLVGAALFAVPLLWGPEFERTVALGWILLPGVAALGAGRVMVASFTGLGHTSYALAVGLVSLPLTVVAYLLVIPGSGNTGAAVVSSISYLTTSLLAAALYARATGLGPREFLVPRAGDLRDYLRLARGLRAEARRSHSGEAPR
jgi:O-antigen/teichoic acid export membrane protein